MSKFTFDHVIDSRTLFVTKQLIVDGKSLLDMSGDKRLDQIIDSVKAKITKEHWQIPKDESSICTYISKKMHSDKYYGAYDKVTSKDLDVIQKTKSQIDSLHLLLAKEKKDNPSFADHHKQLADLEIQYKKENDTLDKHSAQTHDKPLRETKTGETDCFKQSCIMSYAMESVGLHNDLCLGIGVDPGFGHAFVQSQIGKHHIIDSTRSVTIIAANKTISHEYLPYLLNENGGQVSKRQVVITDEGTKYGGGEVPGIFARTFMSPELRKEWIAAGKPHSGIAVIEVAVKANWHHAANEFKEHQKEELDKLNEEIKKLDKEIAKEDKQISKLHAHILEKARHHGEKIDEHFHDKNKSSQPAKLAGQISKDSYPVR